MKKRLLIIFLSLLFVLPFGFGCCLMGTRETSGRGISEPITALVLGTDDAARNTDVIMLLRYDPITGALAVMQVPRDTYLKNALGAPKINHIFPALIASGKTEAAALSETAEILSDAFSVPFDFALSLRPSALARLVDEIGGVTITLPGDLVYDDPEGDASIHLSAGKQTLDGKSAVQFVRYRAGYLEGDLGRVDAQKLFLCAFVDKAVRTMDISNLLSLLVRPPEGMTLLGDKLRLANAAKQFYQTKANLHAVYFSAPGEAVRPESGGAWYYAVNRFATGTLLARYFDLARKDDFDTEARFCGPTLNFENIYFATGYPYRVFTADEIQNIIIKKKE